MGGNPIRVERVEPDLQGDLDDEDFLADNEGIDGEEESSGARIVSLFGDD